VAIKNTLFDMAMTGAGAAIGGLTTGTFEGALIGAQYGRMVGSAALFIPAVRNRLLAACFTGRMPIEVEGGHKRADEVRVGDLVWSQHESDPDGAPALKVVEEVFERLGVVWVVRVQGQEIETTAEHPFWVPNRGAWVPAGELEPGDYVQTRDRRWLPVEAVTETGRVEQLYNFRIADYHTYFVGSEEWGFSVWAHNQYHSSGWREGARKIMGWEADTHHALLSNGWRALRDGEANFRQWAKNKMSDAQADALVGWAKRNYAEEVAQQRAREVAEAAQLMADQGAVNTGEVHITYLKLREVDGKIEVYSGYSGQGGGQLTPREVVAARNNGHSRNAEGYGPSVLDKFTGTLDVAKGREQMLIEHFGSNGLKIGADQIAGTAKNKPEYAPRMKAAEATFGRVEYTAEQMRALYEYQQSGAPIQSVEQILKILGKL
jgi:intein/homing endonuclease